MYKLDLQKAEEPEIKVPTFIGSQKIQKTSTPASLTTLKSLTLDHDKLWKAPGEMGKPDHLTCLLRNLYVGQEATEPDMENLTGSKLRKEYDKTVYCHPAQFTYMQSS